MTSLLQPLARQTPLPPAEFAALVEAQLRTLRERFPKTAFEELRNLPCLWDGVGGLREGRALFRDGPTVDGPNGLSTTTKGVFFVQPPDKISYVGPQHDPNYQVSRDGTVVLYGLTETGKWILAYAEFQYDHGYKNRGMSTATRVVLRYAEPVAIAEAAQIPVGRVLGQTWKALTLRTKSAAEASLREAEERVATLTLGLHSADLAAGWMGLHHAEDVC